MKNRARTRTGPAVPLYLETPRNVKHVSRSHEERIAADFGGRTLPASGATTWSRWNRKSAGGDLDCEQFHIEHKYTDAASLSIQVRWLLRTSEEAFARDKAPALVISFTGPSMNQYDVPEAMRAPQDWMLLPVGVVLKLLEAAKAHEQP